MRTVEIAEESLYNPMTACKFCGGHAMLFKVPEDASWHVGCEGTIDEECRGYDDAYGPGYTDPAYAIEMWNKTPADYARNAG